MRKRKAPYITRKMPKKVPRGRGGYFRDRAKSTTKMTTPSSRASKSWEGWRGIVPAAPPKTTPQGASVTAPHSSPLMKLAQRPKKRPIGAAMQPMSARVP